MAKIFKVLSIPGGMFEDDEVRIVEGSTRKSVEEVAKWYEDRTISIPFVNHPFTYDRMSEESAKKSVKKLLPKKYWGRRCFALLADAYDWVHDYGKSSYVFVFE